MRVSVIIPFNKGDDYLRDCLNSLSEQEYTDYEILLINDHYEGDLQTITGAYEDRLPIRVFTLEDDKTGVAAARNVGLDHATGEFVYFLDADDYIFQDAIRTLVEAADETNEDMVYGKKHFTYFRRDVFLPIYIEKREALIALRMEEDGEGGTDSDSEENDDDESEDS
ncbi:MAG: glycosyltransferase family 2 protein, partial [Lachnospiraceae bacterium]|nr:glycosyltransferase family 2 protein [Lachnospiraceae bacterium]